MNKIGSTIVLLLLSCLGLAQTPPPRSQREVRGQTIVSNDLPAASLTFGKDFRYVGGQVVNLYGNADAEQHLFVKAGSSGPVERFYWVQFEHFLPSKQYTYDYKPERTVNIGSLPFIYDVKSFSGYAAMQAEDPVSDGAAIGRLLAQHHLAFPAAAVRVRMFHLPTPDRRTELMIIYGEAITPDSNIPAAKDGMRLDDAYPDVAKRILDHARATLTIQKQPGPGTGPFPRP